MYNARVVSLTYEYTYQSFHTDFNTNIGVWLRKALEKTYFKEIIMARMGGRSVPIAPFINTVAIPEVIYTYCKHRQ